LKPTIVPPVRALAFDAVTDLVGIRAGRETVTPTTIPVSSFVMTTIPASSHVPGNQFSSTHDGILHR
jgi:hypothetical protein